MQRLLAILRTIAVVGLPIIAALLLAQTLSEHDQRVRATTLARIVLDRAARTTDQLASAFDQMQRLDLANPCSDQGLAQMRKIDLGSSLLQGIGFASGNELVCSSIDGTIVAGLGPPDHITATGQQIRRRSDLDFARGIPLLVVTGPSGYTGFVHPSLIFEMTDGGDSMPSGIVGLSTRALLLSSNPSKIDWSAVAIPDGQPEGTTVLDGELVAWVRSPRWDQFSFASLPWAAVSNEFWDLSRYLLPLGALGSLLALWLLRRLDESRSSLPTLLRTGLRRNEILLVYQPIVDMRTGHWVGAEVLARWRRRSGEWVSPDVFIPIAEKHGLITQLTQFVTDQSLAEIGDLLRQRPGFFLSINISSSDLADPGFLARLANRCAQSNVPPDAVHLEITERQEVDLGAEASVIAALRTSGFKVGTDDFGVGYSNLAYLENFQLDYIKIDRVFVANAFRADAGSEMIDHIIGVGKARNLEIIAEGIERSEQQAQLLARGVILGQGWLFAKAIPAPEFLRQYRAPSQTASFDRDAA